MNTRLLSPYEQTQLAKHGLAPSSISHSQQPVEYATNHSEFCGLDFFVDKSVLIPRVETEGLVELSLQAITEKISVDTPRSILEVGTGSGAIIISVAKHLLTTALPIKLTALDISARALAIAKKNEQQLLPSPHVTWVQSNLLTSLPRQQFDIIIANLPYIPSERIHTLDSSVKDFEPRVALDGGSDGFQIIKQLLDQVVPYLAKRAVLLLEVDSTHTIEWFLPWKNQFAISNYTDCFNRHRFIRLDLLP